MHTAIAAASGTATDAIFCGFGFSPFTSEPTDSSEAPTKTCSALSGACPMTLATMNFRYEISGLSAKQ